MTYLTLDDLKTQGFERFIQESSADFSESIDKAEEIAIGIIQSYLRGKYPVQLIFDTTIPIKEPVLVDICACLTLHKLHSRNNARKWKDEDEYKRIMQMLKDIQSGKMQLDLGLDDSEENNSAQAIYGNNTNQDFYI